MIRVVALRKAALAGAAGALAWEAVARGLILACRAVPWEDSEVAWLEEDDLAIRTATPNKSLRATWKDGKTSLEIAFVQKAANKSQVVVQHSKLPDAKTAAKMKTYWRTKLDRLRAALE